MYLTIANDHLLNKKAKTSNGVYGRKAEKRTPKICFEIHEKNWLMIRGTDTNHKFKSDG